MPNNRGNLWNLYRFHWYHRFPQRDGEDSRAYHNRMAASFQAVVNPMSPAERADYRADLAHAQSANLWHLYLRMWYESNHRADEETVPDFRARARDDFQRATAHLSHEERASYRNRLAALSVKL